MARAGGPLPPLSWLGIARLGLVQTAIGAMFVLSTATLNRVMKVELALPAVIPGALIALQYAVQVLRPRLGYRSDVGGRRTPLIIGGMGGLAAGVVLAAAATGLMTRSFAAGLALAVLAFATIGVGVSAAGTALLVLLAQRTSPARRPAAATIVWVMMIVGFILTAGVAGKLLDPFSPERLLFVALVIAGAGLVVACLAVKGVEGGAQIGDQVSAIARPARPDFAAALRGVWAEPDTRRFAIFVFISMLAYGGEELMIEPFAGLRFAMTPGQTAQLSGLLHGGSLVGMVGFAVVCTALARHAVAALRGWMVGGCIGSGAALAGLAWCGAVGTAPSLGPLLFALGLANGAYAAAAIAAMMQLVSSSGGQDEGVRMGLWGAAQGIAFGCGGLVATGLGDSVGAFGGHMSGSSMWGHASGYCVVFLAQAAVFWCAATIASRLPALRIAHPRGRPHQLVPARRDA